MDSKTIKVKSKRNQILSVLTVVIILLSVALNVLMTKLGEKKTVFLDMTPEGLYSPSDAFLKECEFVGSLEDEIKIIFCTDRDYLISNTYTRATYYTALRLADTYKNLKVETVNVINNPTAVSMYKTTSLSVINPSDIIFAYGDRYRVVNAKNMWTQGSDGVLFSFNGEYRMVGLLKSVSAIDMPKAYFVTNHGESYYDTENPESEMSLSLEKFAHLLTARGLDLDTLDMSKIDEIPEDCALLIINNPREDFTFLPDRLDEYSYVSETEKLDRYLVKEQGAIMVNKDYEVKLPVFESFLYEWGFEFSNTLVKDEKSSLEDENNTHTSIISKYNTDDTSYGYAIYGDFASLSSAPITVFTNTGSISCNFKGGSAMGEEGTPNANRSYVSFLTSSKDAVLYGKNGITGEYTAPASEAGVFDLAALSVRSQIDTFKNEMVYSYLFCTASKEFLSNELLGNASFANYDVVSALIDNISRIDIYGSLELGGTSLNSTSYGGKQLVSTVISTEGSDVYSPDGKHVVRHNYGLSAAAKGVYTAVVFAIPIAVCALGAVVLIKRRFL